MGNSAHSAVINVRILHAFARQKCLAHSKWNVGTVPISEKLETEGTVQECMAEIQKGRIEGEIPVNQGALCVGHCFCFATL